MSSGFPASAGGAGERGQEEAFQWGTSYAETLSRARKRSRPVLVYFPPVGGARDPDFVAGAARALGSPPRAEGVRVGAGEVAELARRFQIRNVPCLLLVDVRENVLARWEDPFPQDLWNSLRDILDQIRRRDSALRRRVQEALERSEKGDAEGAYRAVAAILESLSAPPDVVETAQRVEQHLIRRVRAAMREVLAEEGIREDAELRSRLSKLRAGTRHPGLKEEIQREERRLEETRIGGE